MSMPDVSRKSGASMTSVVLWVATAGILLLVVLQCAGLCFRWAEHGRAKEVSAWTEMHEKLARDASERGELKDAQRFIEEAIKLDPANPELRFRHLRYMVQRAAENPSSIGAEELAPLGYAIAVLSSQDGEDATRFAAVANARLALRKGNNGECRRTLEKAVATWPDYAWAWMALADLERTEGRKLEAMAGFEKAVEKTPQNLAALNNLGVSYVEVGRIEEGLGLCEKAIETRDNPASRVNAADALARLARLEEALEHLRRAAILNPESQDIRHRLNYLQQRLDTTSPGDSQGEAK
jgi:tetratricopeptide (TPR) repeat protein